MKRILCVVALAGLLLSGCSTSNRNDSKQDGTSSTDEMEVALTKANPTNEYFITREGDHLQLNSADIELQAINFDNLTWYQETHMDGTPVYLFHHTEEDYDRIQSLGFNTVRYFIRWQDLFSDPVTCEKQEEGWEWLDQNISWAKERGMFLILDFHCPYGGFGTTGDGTWPIWIDENVRNSFIQMWRIIAREYMSEISIAGYDLMNEPSLPVKGRSDYEKLLEDVISAIREEDMNHVLIVEAAVGIEGDEESYSRPTWVKVSDENVMYSFHFYEPVCFSHKIAENASDVYQYPSNEFSQDDLKIAFENFTDEDFLEKYPLFLGEFGCNDWNEGSGSEQWVSDVYRLCFEKNIHTALFAYRSFEDISEKDGYSFAISRIYLQADTPSGTEEEENSRLIEIIHNLINLE